MDTPENHVRLLNVVVFYDGDIYRMEIDPKLPMLAIEIKLRLMDHVMLPYQRYRFSINGIPYDDTRIIQSVRVESRATRTLRVRLDLD